MTDSNSADRTAITGLGIVSPIGIGIEAFTESLMAGRSGVRPNDFVSFSACPHNVGAEVKDFTDATAKSIYLKSQRKSIKVMCREIQLGVASAALALEDAAVVVDDNNRERVGVDFGANLMFSPPDVLKDACWVCVEDNGKGRQFHFEKWGTAGLGTMEPLWLLKYLPNMPACHICIACDARGPSNSITLDEASGNLVLGEAARIIERGRADVMIAGTTGTRLHPVKSVHAALWDELACTEDSPERWCRPFDRNRTGQVLGEGACSIILERESVARARNAKVYGYFLGCGTSCVLDRNGQPGIRRAIVLAAQAALRDAKLSPKDIGHINAHGLGSRRMDSEEAAAIYEVFGEDAAKIPVTAPKSYFGNSGSGCGTLELAASLVGLRQGVVIPTLNFETPDVEYPLNVVHGKPLPVKNKTVLSISVTRMGQAGVIIVEGA